MLSHLEAEARRRVTAHEAVLPAATDAMGMQSSAAYDCAALTYGQTFRVKRRSLMLPKKTLWMLAHLMHVLAQHHPTPPAQVHTGPACAQLG